MVRVIGYGVLGLSGLQHARVCLTKFEALRVAPECRIKLFDQHATLKQNVRAARTWTTELDIQLYAAAEPFQVASSCQHYVQFWYVRGTSTGMGDK